MFKYDYKTCNKYLQKLDTSAKATAEAIILMLFITRTILIFMTLNSFIPSFSKNN